MAGEEQRKEKHRDNYRRRKGGKAIDTNTGGQSQ